MSFEVSPPTKPLREASQHLTLVRGKRLLIDFSVKLTHVLSTAVLFDTFGMNFIPAVGCTLPGTLCMERCLDGASYEEQVISRKHMQTYGT